MNKRLFRRVVAAITKNYRRLNMKTTIEHTECDTFACFAGWTCLVAEPRKWSKKPVDICSMDYWDMIKDRAIDLLGRNEEINYDALFYASAWPQRFSGRLSQHTPGTPGYLEVALSRFQHFLDTGE